MNAASALFWTVACWLWAVAVRDAVRAGSPFLAALCGIALGASLYRLVLQLTDCIINFSN